MIVAYLETNNRDQHDQGDEHDDLAERVDLRQVRTECVVNLVEIN